MKNILRTIALALALAVPQAYAGMIGIDDSTGSVDVLTVASGNGIVAVGSGDEWTGVSDVELPFP